MLETLVRGRGTGKTTEVIELMNNDDNLLLIVPVKSLKKFYPVQLHNRIFSYRDFLDGEHRGKRFDKVVIDEGFLANKEELAHLYYSLGYQRINVVSYGSL